MNRLGKTFGLILCGGLSRRMGKDKALLDYHGLPQYQWASNLLDPFCDQVFCSVSKILEPAIQANKIVDDLENQGPLGGISSSFSTNNTVNWIVLSCDMPYINAEDVDLLIQDAEVPHCYALEGFINPLFSWWPKNCIQQVIDLYEQGERSPKEVFRALGGKSISPLSEDRQMNINR